MKTPIYQVDAFTDRIFGGNPAAVCPLNEWLPDTILQHIAMENNLSETAFYVKNRNRFEIRWFTPTMEVDLCGHATLASAHVLFNHSGYTDQKIIFETKLRGLIEVFKNGTLLTLDFPATPAIPVNINDFTIACLGQRPLELYQSRDIMAVFENEEDILNIEPDFEKIKQLDCLGVIITAPGNNSDFVSRFFAPKAGILEDSVTGSAHTTLVPYWANRLNKRKLHAFQVSRRKGELFCKNKDGRVWISGQAITYLIGEIESK